MYLSPLPCPPRPPLAQRYRGVSLLLPLYFEYQLVISSLCASPAVRYSHLRPPPPCPPRATPVRNLATQSSSFCYLLSSFGMDHCHRHRVNPRLKRVLVASRLTDATRPGPAQSTIILSCFVIFQGRAVRVSSKIVIKFTRN